MAEENRQNVEQLGQLQEDLADGRKAHWGELTPLVEVLFALFGLAGLAVGLGLIGAAVAHVLVDAIAFGWSLA